MTNQYYLNIFKIKLMIFFLNSVPLPAFPLYDNHHHLLLPGGTHPW